jgi:hypothetical protein
MEDGTVWFGAPPSEPIGPEDPRIVLHPQWRLEVHRPFGQPTLTYLSLDPRTGEIAMGEDVEWGVPAHIHCQLFRSRSAHCTSSHDFHTPPYDFHLHVADDGTVWVRAREQEAPRQVARITPAPATDLEALKALFLLLEQFGRCDHGDSTHDVEF